MDENLDSFACCLCNRRPRDVSLIQDLVERIRRNARERDTAAAPPQPVQAEADPDEIDECPACGAPWASEASLRRLHQKIIQAKHRHETQTWGPHPKG